MNGFWRNNWSLYKGFNYVNFTFWEKVIDSFLKMFFQNVCFFKNSLFYGGHKVIRTVDCMHLIVYIFDGLYGTLNKIAKVKGVFRKTNSNSFKGKVKFDNVLERFSTNFKNFKMPKLSKFLKKFFNPFHNLGLFSLTSTIPSSSLLSSNFDQIKIFNFLEIIKFLFKNDFKGLMRKMSFIFHYLIQSILSNLPRKLFEEMIGTNVNITLEKKMPFNILKKYVSLFTLRETNFGDKLFIESAFVKAEEVKMKKVSIKLIKEERFSLINCGVYISETLSSLLNTKCNFKFVKLEKSISPAVFLCNLLCIKIAKLGRPRSRRNRLTASSFYTFISKILKDLTISGLKIVVAGRINRRGRAMWRIYRYNRFSRGNFSLGVEFARQSIKTGNGVVTVKLFPFRENNVKISHKNFLLFTPYYLANKNFFSNKLEKVKSLIERKVYSPLLDMVENRVSYNRRLKKLRKRVITFEKFSLL